MYKSIRILGVQTLLVSLFLLSLQTATAAQPASGCTTVQLGAFGKSVMYDVAQQEGFFAREGLCVKYNQVVSSTQQFNTFLDGGYDIISTALDNVANRIVNQGKSITMVAAQDKGPGFVLAINTAKGVNSIADLKGHAIAVDAPDSGFVFALRKVLAANGLYYPQDYSFQLVGGTFQRYLSLINPNTTTLATLLNPPFTVAAQDPIKIVAKISDYLAPIQNAGYAVTQSYADSHGPTITAFIKALIEAGSFVADPANHARVVQDEINEQGLPLSQAEAIYQLALDPVSGENLDARMDRQGMVNIIELRTEFGGFTNPPNAMAFVRPSRHGFYDSEFWRAACKSAGQQPCGNGPANE